MRALVAVLALAAASPATAQEGHVCPMAAPADRRSEVDHRHQHATSVPSEGTRHRFVLAKDGGSIRLGALDPSQTGTRDAIRTHLQEVARSFAAGDFSMPMRIHDQVPPGVDVMKARADAIRYVYADSADGGVVTITTREPEALEAVHAFLRFQIRDHGTGDPIE